MWAKIALAATIVALEAAAMACGAGDDRKAMPDVTAGDLPKLALRLSDLPEGYEQVDVCGDASAQSAVPTPNHAILLFFELPAASETTGADCVASAAVLLDSTEEASRALEGIDKNFNIMYQPLVDHADCSVEDLDIPGLGEDYRAYGTTCGSCPEEAVQLYQIAFRRGAVLSEVLLFNYDCPPARDQAIAYARKQAQRVETALRGDE